MSRGRCLDAREAAACTAGQERDDQARRSPPCWESARAVFGEGNLSSEKCRGGLGREGGGVVGGGPLTPKSSKFLR